MSDTQNEYIKRLATEARKQCENKNIINDEQYKLSLATLENVVSFFNGSLNKISSNELKQNCSQATNSFTKKISSNRFIIEYVDFSILDILHNLGYLFLDFDKMKVGEIHFPHDFHSGLEELEAAKWARFFAMPENLFQQALIKHACDIQAVADIFGVDEIQITTHGRETRLWE